jgi:hypothetical protein
MCWTLDLCAAAKIAGISTVIAVVVGVVQKPDVRSLVQSNLNEVFWANVIPFVMHVFHNDDVMCFPSPLFYARATLLASSLSDAERGDDPKLSGRPGWCDRCAAGGKAEAGGSGRDSRAGSLQRSRRCGATEQAG